MKLGKKLSALILAAAFTALPLMANAQQPVEDKPIVLPWAACFLAARYKRCLTEAPFTATTATHSFTFRRTHALTR